MMTYAEVIAFAMEHYEEGGDSVVECLSLQDYKREVKDGKIFTKKNLLEDFKLYESIRNEIINA